MMKLQMVPVTLCYVISTPDLRNFDLMYRDGSKQGTNHLIVDDFTIKIWYAVDGGTGTSGHEIVSRHYIFTVNGTRGGINYTSVHNSLVSWLPIT